MINVWAKNFSPIHDIFEFFLSFIISKKRFSLYGKFFIASKIFDNFVDCNNITKIKKDGYKKLIADCPCNSSA
jgi:hypothetical protein